MTTVAELEANMKEMALNNNKMHGQEHKVNSMGSPQVNSMGSPQVPIPIHAQLQQQQQRQQQQQQPHQLPQQLMQAQQQQQQQNLQVHQLLNQQQQQFQQQARSPVPGETDMTAFNKLVGLMKASGTLNSSASKLPVSTYVLVVIENSINL